MRSEGIVAGGSPQPRGVGYPSPIDRHPVFMFGWFPIGAPAARRGGSAEEALLCIREEAGEPPPEIHPHQHADVTAADGHRFMFGAAAEQAVSAPPDEPRYYFWDVGEA